MNFDFMHIDSDPYKIGTFSVRPIHVVRTKVIIFTKKSPSPRYHPHDIITKQSPQAITPRNPQAITNIYNIIICVLNQKERVDGRGCRI
jgi:hypothetical protein